MLKRMSWKTLKRLYGEPCGFRSIYLFAMRDEWLKTGSRSRISSAVGPEGFPRQTIPPCLRIGTGAFEKKVRARVVEAVTPLRRRQAGRTSARRLGSQAGRPEAFLRARKFGRAMMPDLWSGNWDSAEHQNRFPCRSMTLILPLSARTLRVCSTRPGTQRSRDRKTSISCRG